MDDQSKYVHRRNIALLILLFLIPAFFAGYFFERRPAGSPARTLTKVVLRLNWVNNAQFAGIYTAKEKGYFAAEGLDVEIKEYEEGLDQMKELVDGGSDFSIATGVELISSIANGAPIKGLAVIYQTSPESFASLKSKHILSPADFKGKVLAQKGGTVESATLYQVLLDQAQLKASDVTHISLDYRFDLADDLLTGRADVVNAYRTDGPYIFKNKGVEYNLILPEDYGLSAYGDTIFTSRQTMDMKPELVGGFVRAALAGWEYALIHQDEALAITKKYENPLYQDPALERFVLSEGVNLIWQPSRGRIGAMNFTIWNEIVHQMKSAGIVSRDFDTGSVYTNKFLPRE